MLELHLCTFGWALSLIHTYIQLINWEICLLGIKSIRHWYDMYLQFLSTMKPNFYILLYVPCVHMLVCMLTYSTLSYCSYPPAWPTDDIPTIRETAASLIKYVGLSHVVSIISQMLLVTSFEGMYYIPHMWRMPLSRFTCILIYATFPSMYFLASMWCHSYGV